MSKRNTKTRLSSKKVGFCRFKKLNDKYLVTNDIGRYVFLSPEEFKKFTKGDLEKNSAAYFELEGNEFINDSLDFNNLIEKYRQRNEFIFQGPSLHIVVITLRCNQKCVYCQASRRPIEEKQYDMSIETAKKVVDTIFCSPSGVISIEFQGGEPILNWPVIKFIVEYAEKKNKIENKKLILSLVSNLALITEKQYKFLIKNRVKICTSLDGPKEIHNKNRPCPGKDSYQTTVSWIKKSRKEELKKEKEEQKFYHLSALVTISRFSLNFPKEIVDEYIKWGFNGVHLRQLSSLGLSGGIAKEKIGYSADEFLKFWKKSMDYIISINLKGKFFFERGARIMLKKILTDHDPGFLDLRAPCGAAIGQLAYDYDGKVYTCDEGRMLGDDTFMLGNVNKNSYKEIISNSKTKTMIMASTLENSACDYCVYKPYCGVCPVLNFVLSGNLFPQLSNTDWCKTHKEMLDYIFEKMQDKKIEEIFWQWVIKGRG